MRRPGRALAAAWIFLTRVPLPAMDLREADFADAPGFYPLVGLAIGAVGAAAYAAGHAIAGPAAGAVVALGATILATGAFHEDGLADLFDGLGAQTPERMFEIMRDSRLGTFGTAALVIVLALKAVLLAGMPLALACAALGAAHALSRLSAVLVIATSRYAREEGAAKPVAQGIARMSLAVAGLTGAAVLVSFALWAGPGAALWVLGGMALGHAATRKLFERRLGGYTGDCLGAVQQVSEVGFYMGLAAWL